MRHEEIVQAHDALAQVQARLLSGEPCGVRGVKGGSSPTVLANFPAIHTWTPSTHLVSNHRRKSSFPKRATALRVASVIKAAIKSDLELLSMDSVMPKTANLPHPSAGKEDNLEMVL